MRNRRWLALALLASLVGCGQRATEEVLGDVRMNRAYSSEAPPAEAGAPEGVAEEPALASPVDEAKQSGGTTPAALRNRKMIYRATLAVEVRQLHGALTQARQLAEQAGGFVAQLDEQGGKQARSATLVIKVPAARFETVLEQLGKLGEVLDRDLETEDVSEQWVDLDARLRNKQREEERMLALLGRAERMQDLLLIERELSRVRGEIEQLTGQLRHLNDQIALSKITVMLGLPAEVDATVNSGSWVSGTFSRAAATFVKLGKWLTGVLIYLLVLSPYLLIVVGLAWLARRGRRRH